MLKAGQIARALADPDYVYQEALLAVERVIAGGDVSTAYDPELVRSLACLSQNMLWECRVKLRQAFPRLSVREFDRRVREARQQSLAALKQPCETWASSLITGKSGDPKSLLANAITALRDAPEWGGVLAFDEFAVRSVRLRAAPWGGDAGVWTDTDDIRAAEWLQHKGVTVSTHVASEAVQAVAHQAAFHPVRDFLNGLEWDGIPRIDRWLPTYFGTEDSAYTRAVGSRWLISAVARVMNPGCQVDHCLIFEGGQGTHKSTSLRIMAGDQWFSDQIADLHDKQASQDLQGKWIIEWAELAKMKKADAETLKSFVTRRIDHFRPAYGRRPMDFPRQCIFAASTNLDSYLADDTGARRFWPVRCSSIDLDGLARDRLMLWAEARVRFEDGCQWWLESGDLIALARVQQDARHEHDVWLEPIAEWLSAPHQRNDNAGSMPAYTTDQDSTTVSDVLAHAIGKRLDLWTLHDKSRVGSCLKLLGLKRRYVQRQTGEGREWRYFRKDRCQQ